MHADSHTGQDNDDLRISVTYLPLGEGEGGRGGTFQELEISLGLVNIIHTGKHIS